MHHLVALAFVLAAVIATCESQEGPREQRGRHASGFTLDTNITMADGGRRAIGEILLGDRVLSWDVRANRSTTALVLDVPRYQTSHLMKLLLETGECVYSTEDQLYFSRRKQDSVSRDPNSMKKDQGLDVGWLEDNEVFANEQGLPVKGTFNSWKSTPACISDGLIASEPDQVATLSLSEHHWFYAYGVRVHSEDFGGERRMRLFVRQRLRYKRLAVRKPRRKYDNTEVCYDGRRFFWIIPAIWLLRRRQQEEMQCWVSDEGVLQNHSSCVACTNLTCIHQQGPVHGKDCATWLNQSLTCGIPPIDDQQDLDWFGSFVVIIVTLLVGVGLFFLIHKLVHKCTQPDHPRE